MGAHGARSRTVEVVRSREALAALAPAWDRLERVEPTPFGAHAWFCAWWDAFGGADELRVVALWEGDELAGALPLRRSGRRLLALANVHTPVFRPLAVDAAALATLLEAARVGAPGRLTLGSLPTDAAALAAVERAARARRARTLRTPTHVSPYVDTSGSFDAWRAESKRRWGAPLERFRRKMLRDHGAEIRVVERPVDLAAELRRGFEVEASGWKGANGTAILSQPETTRFYEAVAAAAHARDELRLSSVTLDGELAAFDLTLLRAGRLYLLKTGFDERFRRLAPGLVMRLAIVERCFELGLDRHELLGDDSEWKRKFATGTRAHVTLDVFERRPAPLAAYAWSAGLAPALRRVRAEASRAGASATRALPGSLVPSRR